VNKWTNYYRVFEDGEEIEAAVSGVRVGDKVGCGIETQDDDLQYIYFTRNGDRVRASSLFVSCLSRDLIK